MSLVGTVMKAINRRGDPVVIKKMLVERITEIKNTGKFVAPKGLESEE